MSMIKLTVPVDPVEIEAPEDATHYVGDHDSMTFYKRPDIGVVGEHWFRWNGCKWMMEGNRKPLWINNIPEEWKI